MNVKEISSQTSLQNESSAKDRLTQVKIAWSKPALSFHLMFCHHCVQKDSEAKYIALARKKTDQLVILSMAFKKGSGVIC